MVISPNATQNVFMSQSYPSSLSGEVVAGHILHVLSTAFQMHMELNASGLLLDRLQRPCVPNDGGKSPAGVGEEGWAGGITGWRGEKNRSGRWPEGWSWQQWHMANPIPSFLNLPASFLSTDLCHQKWSCMSEETYKCFKLIPVCPWVPPPLQPTFSCCSCIGGG